MSTMGARAPAVSAIRPGAPAAAFFALTLVWSWAFFGLAIALGGELPAPHALVPWAVGAAGPVLAALALTWRTGGGAGLRRLVRRSLDVRRIGARWWAVILVVAFAPNATAVALLTASSGSLPASVAAAEVTALSALFVIAFGLAAGLAEEPGWRGVALERLSMRRSILAAALVIGVAWALWHLPLFFVAGTFQHELGFGSSGFAWFLLQLLPNAVLLAWIVLRTGGLVAAAVALHALGNAAGELIPLADGERWLSLALLATLAAAIALHDRRLLRRPWPKGAPS